MEYALWQIGDVVNANFYGLNPCSNGICSLTFLKCIFYYVCLCLNPCSNGICSLTKESDADLNNNICLNPCSNGICSLTYVVWTTDSPVTMVLILVLMEYALWQFVSRVRSPSGSPVLILVLMEYALWQWQDFDQWTYKNGYSDVVLS